jgi:hypothetical protein
MRILNRNQYTGKLIRCTGSGKLQARKTSSDPIFNNIDCCCFLKTYDNYSVGEVYSQGDYVRYGITGTRMYKSLKDLNVNNTPSISPLWWEFVGFYDRSCGDDEFDQYFPFGGAGRSPKYYTVTISGLVDNGECPSINYRRCHADIINGKHILTTGGKYRQFGACYFRKDLLVEGEGAYGEILAVVFKLGGVNVNWQIGGFSEYFTVSVGPCSIEGSGDNKYDEFDNQLGYGGTAVWYPGRD